MGGVVRDRSFSESDIIQTDGGHFIGCTFDGSILQYGGGEHPKFEDCTLDEVSWLFNQAALRTIQFLQTINASDGGPAFIADLFKPGNYITASVSAGDG